MSAYTASFGQTKTCFAAAKSAAPGRVARKVGQVVTKITITVFGQLKAICPFGCLSDILYGFRLSHTVLRSSETSSVQRAEAPLQECHRDARHCSASLRGKTLSSPRLRSGHIRVTGRSAIYANIIWYEFPYFLQARLCAGW